MQLLKKVPSLAPVRLLTRNQSRSWGAEGRHNENLADLKYFIVSWNSTGKAGTCNCSGLKLEILPLAVDRHEWINMKQSAWTRQKEKQIKSTFFYSHVFWILTIETGAQTAAHDPGGATRGSDDRAHTMARLWELTMEAQESNTGWVTSKGRKRWPCALQSNFT